GYLKILGIVDDSKIDIPNLSVGDKLLLSGKKPVTTEQKFTQPPARFSESNLIKTLESKNIGRPATYAELLSKITSRNYVDIHGNVYHPTELGKKITDELVKFFSFMEYDYTADMEEKLDSIETGNVDQLKMLSDFFIPFKVELQKAYTNNGSNPCEKCGSPMATRTARNGDKFLGCSAYPKCKNTKQITEAKSVA
ncbi:MAG TPA: DNA topoisomerase, partial [Cytophagaceae bacterium]|nr:DNA topoisomerase [Cytophagaceae bacterium]